MLLRLKSFGQADDPFILPEDAVIGKVKGTGDVDITIILRNGISTKMRLHICSEQDGKKPGPMETVYFIFF